MRCIVKLAWPVDVLLGIMAVSAALIGPATAGTEMCTGVIVGAPATLLYSGKTNSYKNGDVVEFLTQYQVANGQGFFCQWGGDCISDRNVRLRRVMAVRGNISTMTTAQVMRSAYETNRKCKLSDLPRAAR